MEPPVPEHCVQRLASRVAFALANKSNKDMSMGIVEKSKAAMRAPESLVDGAG